MSEKDWFPTIMWIVGALVIAAAIYALENDNCERSGGHLRWILNNSLMCLYPDGRVVQ